MRLQELVNKLSNLLASRAGGAGVKVDDKAVEAVTLVEVDGVKTVVITTIAGGEKNHDSFY